MLLAPRSPCSASWRTRLRSTVTRENSAATNTPLATISPAAAASRSRSRITPITYGTRVGLTSGRPARRSPFNQDRFCPHTAVRSVPTTTDQDDGPGTAMATFVLVPGAWLGGWAWQRVARPLRQAGHEVYPVTLTGLGERVHLGGPEVSLETHVTDIVNLFEYEDLWDAVLVGHSYGGTPVCGAADRLADRLAAVVYLACGPLPDGTGMLDVVPPEAAEAQRRSVQEHGDGWRLPMPSWADLAAGGAGLGGLSGPNWTHHELLTSHWPMFSRPADTAGLLAEIAG